MARSSSSSSSSSKSTVVGRKRSRSRGSSKGRTPHSKSRRRRSKASSGGRKRKSTGNRTPLSAKKAKREKIERRKRERAKKILARKRGEESSPSTERSDADDEFEEGDKVAYTNKRRGLVNVRATIERQYPGSYFDIRLSDGETIQTVAKQLSRADDEDEDAPRSSGRRSRKDAFQSPIASRKRSTRRKLLKKSKPANAKTPDEHVERVIRKRANARRKRKSESSWLGYSIKQAFYICVFLVAVGTIGRFVEEHLEGERDHRRRELPISTRSAGGQWTWRCNPGFDLSTEDGKNTCIENLNWSPSHSESSPEMTKKNVVGAVDEDEEETTMTGALTTTATRTTTVSRMKRTSTTSSSFLSRFFTISRATKGIIVLLVGAVLRSLTGIGVPDKLSAPTTKTTTRSVPAQDLTGTRTVTSCTVVEPPPYVPPPPPRRRYSITGGRKNCVAQVNVVPVSFVPSAPPMEPTWPEDPNDPNRTP